MTITQISGTVFPAQSPGYDVVRLPQTWATLIAADDPLWNGATVIEWGPERYRTRFQACWDRLALHVRFDAVDDGPWHTMTTRDDHIWEEEVVEIFLDADGSGRNYAELEINPVNVVCDLIVESPWPSLTSLTEWDWAGMTTAVVPLEDRCGTAQGWTALARLPWSGLRSLYPAPAVALPPRPGDAWRCNVFRIKRPGGPTRPQDGVVLAAWSRPAGPSFHDPAAFRPMVFR
ncbi:MAG: carbohydrate-binding family 9-like protein [Vicinamibacteria bacterium]|nr:carbohydrate-binding family 9-like protein [Vicinamibacteria bacterium]